MTEKQKKSSWFKRHPILTAVFAIIIIFIIGASGSSKNGENNGLSSSGKSQESWKEYRTWESVPTGKMTYILNGVSTNATLGSAYTKKDAIGVFKVIDITVKNEDKEPITIDSSLFKIIDDQGREFSSSVEWRTALSMQWEKDFFLTQAQPGLETKGKLVFDIPKDATGLKLEVSGWFRSSSKNLIILE